MSEYRPMDDVLDGIKYFKSNSHTSLGEARFLASQYLSGDYIAILDVDDLYHPDKLKKQSTARKELDSMF